MSIEYENCNLVDADFFNNSATLLNGNFDPNMRFSQQHNGTSLHIAARNGNMQLVALLIKAGADINLMDDMWQTPLMLAVEKRFNIIVQYLINMGAALHLKNKIGMTVLHVAVQNNNLEACILILDSKTSQLNIDSQDNAGWNALMWACDDNSQHIARLLIEKGSDIALTDDFYNTALHWAAYYNCKLFCEILLENGAGMYKVNKEGESPLQVAAKRNSYEVLGILASRKDFDMTKNSKALRILRNMDKRKLRTFIGDDNYELVLKFKDSTKERLIHRDISFGKEPTYPIQCVNNVDESLFPEDFVYASRDILPGNGIFIEKSLDSLISCKCKDNCEAVFCLCNRRLNSKCWYNQYGRLSDEYSFQNVVPIYECNSACVCWSTCKNRVVQNGLRCALQVFRTNSKGWGVRILHDLEEKSFVCEYIGTIVRKRDAESDYCGNDYLFGLYNQNEECIDAKSYGNVSRFINHSCEPNMEAIEVFYDHQDEKYPRIAFFSNRKLFAYEELSFDYGSQFWEVMGRNTSCMCGSNKCRYSATKSDEEKSMKSRTKKGRSKKRLKKDIPFIYNRN